MEAKDRNVSLTAQQRAEKIVVDYVNLYHIGMIPEASKLIGLIAAQLEEAEREAYKRGYE